MQQHYYLRRTFYVLATATLTVFVMVEAKTVLVPLAYAALFAVLLSYVVGWLSKFMPRGAAVALSVATLAGLVFGLGYLAGQQVVGFVEELPALRDRFVSLGDDVVTWVAKKTSVAEASIEERVDERIDAAPGQLASTVRDFAGSATAFLGDLMLFFVYTTLLLLARDHLYRFVLKLAPDGSRANIRDALDSVRDVAGSYVWGQAILIAVLFAVYAAGFSLAGLEYALVVAAVGATFSLVPYLGNVAAAVLVVVVASLSGDFANVILICLGTMAVAQVVESYILQPLIVGGEVGLHPLSTVVAVIAMSAIWGLPGAILSIPIVGVLRQVLYHVPNGEPWAYLLGEPGEGE